MKREEAIKKFGVHYYIDTVHLPESQKNRQFSHLLRGIFNGVVVEGLKQEYHDDDEPKTTEDVTAAYMEKQKKNIETRLAEIAVWEKSLRIKFRIAAAKIGLRRDSAGYLERVDNIYQVKAMLEERLKDIPAPLETRYLPDEMKMPVLLDEGRTVYKVEAYYLERAMDMAKNPLTTSKIKNITIEGGRHRDGDYDYVFKYHLDNGDSFYYPFDKENDEPIDGRVVNYRHFLSEKGAREYLRGIAQRITNAMKPYI